MDCPFLALALRFLCRFINAAFLTEWFSFSHPAVSHSAALPIAVQSNPSIIGLLFCKWAAAGRGSGVLQQHAIVLPAGTIAPVSEAAPDRT